MLGPEPSISDAQPEFSMTDNIHELGIDPMGTQSEEKTWLLPVERA